MRVLIAPDSFKGTLGAAEAAAALAQGWRRTRPDDEIIQLPLADGGDGTLAVVEAATPGAERRTVEVADARGRATQADWLALPDGTAVVEAAQAVGLGDLPPEERDPLTATSYGVGQLLADAAAHARAITVGLGGSATSDGGGGLATALGHRLLRADGNGVKVGARWLTELDRVVPGPPLGVPVDVAVDVTNPLLGPEGAVAVFAPQKGASERDLPVLEQALAHLADIAERDLPGGPWRDLPGAGAAGGLGWALAAWCDARLRSGGQWIAELVGFDAALAQADAVIFAEGSLDAQTTGHGKIGAHVAERARARGVRLLAVAGAVSEGARGVFDDVEALGPHGLERPAALAAERAEALASRQP